MNSNNLRNISNYKVINVTDIMTSAALVDAQDRES